MSEQKHYGSQTMIINSDDNKNILSNNYIEKIYIPYPPENIFEDIYKDIYTDNRILFKGLFGRCKGMEKEICEKRNDCEWKPHPFFVDENSKLLLNNNTHPNVLNIKKKYDKKNIEIDQIREIIKFTTL